MRSLKNHISLIIPLFSILFAIEFYLIIDRVIGEYEGYLANDYSIVVVSQKELDEDEIKRAVPSIASLKKIETNLVIDNLRQEGIELDFDQLQKKLPRFYRIFLHAFPSQQQLQKIKEELGKVDGIKRVEAFVRTHQQVYRSLLFVKQIARLFLVIIFITSVMLVIKQIEVWILEHKERMYIMALFGAPLWMRISILVKLCIIDTFISAVLVLGSYYYLISSGVFVRFLGVKDIDVSVEQIVYDMRILLVVGLVLSVASVFVVSARQRGYE